MEPQALNLTSGRDGVAGSYQSFSDGEMIAERCRRNAELSAQMTHSFSENNLTELQEVNNFYLHSGIGIKYEKILGDLNKR